MPIDPVDRIAELLYLSKQQADAIVTAVERIVTDIALVENGAVLDTDERDVPTKLLDYLQEEICR